VRSPRFAPIRRALGGARPWAVAEVAIAAFLTLRLLTSPGLFGLVRALAVASVRGVASSLSLLAVDGAGTLGVCCAALLRSVLILVPVWFWARGSLRRGWVWLPVASGPFLAVLGLSFAAVSTPVMWGLLAVSATVGGVLARRGRLAFAALLPAVVCLEPALSHSPLSDRYWTTERLAPRCAGNDGRRPAGFTADMALSRYYSVTPLDDDLAIVVGDRRAYWMRRRAGGAFALESPSAVRGNLWQGCVAGRAVHFVKNHHFFRLERLPEGSEAVERVTDFAVPDPPGVFEMDLAEPSCDPAHDRVFATEVNGGGIRELHLGDGSQIRTEVGGFNLQYMRRRDGMLVGIDTARLVVFDPDARRVVESHAAGLGVMGIDLCPVDDTVALTDMAGRVRVFERAPSGAYRFHAGTSVAAPRRIAFSPDCRMIGVTSADDQTVWSLRRADLSVARRHRVGPGLRDVVFVGPREIAVADACMATFLDAGE
jgi:hypothetical protein